MHVLVISSAHSVYVPLVVHVVTHALVLLSPYNLSGVSGQAKAITHLPLVFYEYVGISEGSSPVQRLSHR